MATVLTDSTNYENIADAIRNQNGTSETYYPSAMAAAISELSPPTAVLYTEQTLTDEQKAQARTNIGALEDSAVSDWAKASTKPSYTASEVGADPRGSAARALTNAKSYTDSALLTIDQQLDDIKVQTGMSPQKVLVTATVGSYSSTMDYPKANIGGTIYNGNMDIYESEGLYVRSGDIIIFTIGADSSNGISGDAYLKIDGVTVASIDGTTAIYNWIVPDDISNIAITWEGNVVDHQDYDGNFVTIRSGSVNVTTTKSEKTFYEKALPKTIELTLSASAWDSTAKTQTATVTGVLADETTQLITPTPALASQTAYYEAGILCTGQAADSLTFTATTVPTANLTVYVVIQDVIPPPPVTLISFIIHATSYQAEEGMIWEEWVNSEYNTCGAFVDVSGRVLYTEGHYIYYESSPVDKNSQIVADYGYSISTSGGVAN